MALSKAFSFLGIEMAFKFIQRMNNFLRIISFKIVLVGDFAVGKSNLLATFATDELYPNSKSTIGVEVQTQKMEINGIDI